MAAVTATVLAATAVAATVAGTAVSMNAASKQADAQAGIVKQQQKGEKVREKQMELDAKRRQLELIRNAQRTRSASLSIATAQNAQFGSGLQGAYGQTSGMSGFNMLGVQQNVEFGRQMFDINQTMGDYQIAYANAGSQMAMGQGLTSLGGALMNSMGPITRLSGGFSPAPSNAYNPTMRGSLY